jgi:hypothetical protein
MTPVFKEFVKKRIFPNSPAFRGALRGGRGGGGAAGATSGSREEIREGTGMARGKHERDISGGIEEEGPREGRGEGGGRGEGKEGTFVQGSVANIDSFYYLRDVSTDSRGSGKPGEEGGKNSGEGGQPVGGGVKGLSTDHWEDGGRDTREGVGSREGGAREGGGTTVQRLHTFLDVGSGTIYRYRFNRAVIVKVSNFSSSPRQRLLTYMAGVSPIPRAISRASNKFGNSTFTRYGVGR